MEKNTVKKTKSTAATRAKPLGGAKPRLASRGDTPPHLTTKGINAYAVDQAIEAATTAKTVALQDILAGVAPGDTAGLVKALGAVMEGASPDDAAAFVKPCWVIRNRFPAASFPLRPMISCPMTGAMAVTLTRI